ncbi:hypothetical protein Dimus_000948, partial [Dionaea muscipula]
MACTLANSSMSNLLLVAVEDGFWVLDNLTSLSTNDKKRQLKQFFGLAYDETNLGSSVLKGQ